MRTRESMMDEGRLRIDEPVRCSASILQPSAVVRYVCREDTSGWRFMDAPGVGDDLFVIRWAELVALDPSLGDVGDLPDGWYAWRETRETPWIRARLDTRTPRIPINYRLWLTRVLGWDAVLPVMVSAGAVLIARTWDAQPPADVLALVGLPVVAFAIRLMVGMGQIRRNGGGRWLRRAQSAALLVALFVLAFVDFFIAWEAFVPPGQARRPLGLLPVYVVAAITYLSLVAFAMYPGRGIVPKHGCHEA